MENAVADPIRVQKHEERPQEAWQRRGSCLRVPGGCGRGLGNEPRAGLVVQGVLRLPPPAREKMAARKPRIQSWSNIAAKKGYSHRFSSFTELKTGGFGARKSDGSPPFSPVHFCHGPLAQASNYNVPDMAWGPKNGLSDENRGGGFRCQNFGSTLHLKVENAWDLRRVGELDEAHWVATSAPIVGINVDPVFLELVDTDHDGRIGCAELRQAISWLFEHLKYYAGANAGSTALMLAAIRNESDEGRRIVETAIKIVKRLGSTEESRITLDQVRRIKEEEEGRAVSEAGIVLPEAARGDDAAALRQFLSDILATVGGDSHPSGSQGVSRKYLDEFLAETESFLCWLAKTQRVDGEPFSPVMPLGETTFSAYSLFSSLRNKIDEYFVLCQTLLLDRRVGEQMLAGGSHLEKIDFSDPSAVQSLLVRASLAPPQPDGVLDFDSRINPHYAVQLEDLRKEVLLPLLEGAAEKELTKEQWGHVKECFSPHENWIDSKPACRVEGLGAERLREYLNDSQLVRAARELMDQSKTTAFVLDNVRLLEKVILYQAYLLSFANNFVSFPDLYNPKKRALFEMGTLIMDGRHFNLSIRVHDRSQHANIARASNMLVLYVEVGSKEKGKLYEVAVPVTSGSRGILYAGKRGVFREVDGREMDALVVEILENPISLWEAVMAPFQRLARAVTGKIEKITGAAEEKLDAAGSEAVVGVQAAFAKKQPASQVPAAPSGQVLGGLLAGGGIALAALGSSAAFVVKTFASLTWESTLAGILAAVAAVAVPASLVAHLKLRRRDLSAILEASGWAINARMRLTRRQAEYFTLRARIPERRKGRRGPPLVGVGVAGGGNCRHGRPHGCTQQI